MGVVSHTKEASVEFDRELQPRFTRESLVTAPRHRVPEDEMLPQSAYQLVTDEVMLDGNARLNLATFVTTWMDDEANRLYAETVAKNLVDKDEYPQTAEIEARCVSMVANLWHAPDEVDAVGTSTTGSSEGCMLAGLALKKRWQEARRAAGKTADRPNIVMGANVQVVWEKFAVFWDVEPRYVPCDDSALYLTAERMLPYVDENTIGVVAILGSTMEGSYEPVAEICSALDDLERRDGISVPVHVDAASGGFVAPFIQPDLVWDFRLPRVASIQASGHKYGMTYPGAGWVVWRHSENLPESLMFKVNYLGGEMPTFGLNFSRPGAQVLLQYYQFLRLGMDGYRRVQQTCQDVAVYLSGAINEMPEFTLVSEGRDLPVFAFRLADDVTRYTAYDVSRKLRERGWLVPAYSVPPNREDLVVLRIVVRYGFTHDLAELFLRDLRNARDWLNALEAPMPQERHQSAFHH